MQRENRYIVIKREDVELLDEGVQLTLGAILRRIATSRRQRGKSQQNYVVVAEDWPMYEDTWKAIEQWVDGMSEHPNDT